jgi:hypothetical protein
MQKQPTTALPAQPERFLLNLSALGMGRGTGRRVWRAVVGLRGSGSLVGGSAVGRVVWSGFGASLMELGSSLGALNVFLIPDDSLLFSTISRCLVSSLVVIGRLVVEISSSRSPPPSLHALMQGGRKYVADEGYVTCSSGGCIWEVLPTLDLLKSHLQEAHRKADPTAAACDCSRAL